MKKAYNTSGLLSFFVILLLLILSLEANDLALAANWGSAGGSNEQVSERGVDVKQRLERLRSAMAVHKRNIQRLREISGVVASGVGLTPDGEPVVRVFTERPLVRGIPQMLEGVPVRAQVSGRFYARDRGATCDASGDKTCQAWERWPLPVPIGVSVGHPAITAGTLGARVTDGTNVYILSNNHVLANINQAKIGDPILQPGSYDGGVNPGDAIGNLTAFESIKFCTVWWFWLICNQTNTIDAAIARSTPGEIGAATPLGENNSIKGYGAPSPILHSAYGDPKTLGDEDLGQLLGKMVQKYGRTTGLKPGTVEAVDVTVDVCYDSSCTKIARFEDQLIITPETFSTGGDSGSLIVTDDVNKNPVGLLFAGSDTNTIANRIDLVLNRFNVTVDDGGSGLLAFDLAITGIDVPSNVMEDESTTVTVTVRNLGTQEVDATVTLKDMTEAVQVGTVDVTNLASGDSKSLDFPWTPATGGLHTLQASHDLGDDKVDNNTFTKDVTVLLPSSGPQLQVWKGLAYTERWTTVQLGYEYGDEMVVACSPNYDLSAPGPAIVRVRNASGSSFEVGLGRPWYGTWGDENFSANVYCMVVRQGVYTAAEDGVQMEAVKLPGFSLTDRARSWSGMRQPYQNAYSRPVVVGQVVSPDTGNAPSYCPGGRCASDWSVFWSRGTGVTNPPSSSALYVGRHSGEDPNPRPAETLVYIVIEAGAGTIGGRGYLAGLGADTVRGMDNRPPFTYPLSGLTSASTAVVSQSGMDGADGGWAILYGPSAVSANQLKLAIEEDWYYDPECSHTTEQVAYIVFE
jgi:hypothetical protein